MDAHRQKQQQMNLNLKFTPAKINSDGMMVHFMSTWLNHGVSSYLVKHTGFFSENVLTSIRSVGGPVLSVEGLNRTKGWPFSKRQWFLSDGLWTGTRYFSCPWTSVEIYCLLRGLQLANPPYRSWDLSASIIMLSQFLLINLCICIFFRFCFSEEPNTGVLDLNVKLQTL